MTLKRALVVDDSRSARVSLQKLLEEQGLAVDLAVSGEAALEFLQHHLVDVIFMDHTMPGMDGLEAVSAIKRNPRTATIPVMMYTTKEGEVYVGQARALGAVGVMPKQVQPGALFDMLLKLGLVRDRRAPSGGARDPSPSSPAEAAPATGAAVATPAEPVDRYDAVDRDYDQQAVGMSVQALVTRILEDQHSALRSDMLRSNRSFARQVAAEIFERQRDLAARQSAEEAVPAEDEAQRPRASGSGMGLMLVLVTGLLILGGWVWLLNEEVKALPERLATVIANRPPLRAVAVEAVAAADAAEAGPSAGGLLRALSWALNRDGAVGFDEVPLNPVRTAELRELLQLLQAAGFRGTLRLDLHLGQFCLVSDDAGRYRLAPPELPLTRCAFIGHPLDDSSFLSERQSNAFEAFVSQSALLQSSGIELDVVALDRLESLPREAYPAAAETAGEWNRIAARNHRIEYSLRPAEPAAEAFAAGP